MRNTWSRLIGWAYDLKDSRRWQLWVVLAVVASILMSRLSSPWTWITTLPIAAFGVLLFGTQARRQHDEETPPSP